MTGAALPGRLGVPPRAAATPGRIGSSSWGRDLNLRRAESDVHQLSLVWSGRCIGIALAVTADTQTG